LYWFSCVLEAEVIPVEKSSCHTDEGAALAGGRLGDACPKAGTIKNALRNGTAQTVANRVPKLLPAVYRRAFGDILWIDVMNPLLLGNVVVGRSNVNMN
jgi:hypothetical protein